MNQTVQTTEVTVPVPKCFCTNCGSEVHEKAVVCVKCGVPPQVENQFCYNCGTGLNPNQVVCVKCGLSLVKDKRKSPGMTSAESGQKNKITAALLSWLLGFIGIHKFYHGSWGWGILYIAFVVVTFGFGAIVTGIIAFVEAICYLVMEDDAYHEKYNETPPHPFKW
ncbi:MAG: TM2 domain-containing protein [Planctomycetaceae bacterium]|jgi:TM2 domain-containing membrane protein YozV|nr:TM2 domain-containing protein [Planctomycetaceae bacterium]